MIQDKALAENLWRIAPHSFAARASKGKWIPYSHLQYISRKVQQTIAKGNGRLIIEAPPRHGKSELISHWTPTWFLDLFPERKVILTSYGDKLARKFGRKVKTELMQNPFCTTRLRHDSKAANEFMTLEGGGMITAGIGGPITGEGGHLLLIDDALKNSKDADSETIREGQKEWFNSTAYTRLEPGGTIIVLMTRWHEDDLAGYLQDDHEDEWEVIRLPALAEEGDALGRAVGEALCPERYDEERLAKIKLAVGSRVWNALFQQRPSTSEGNIFKRHWWKYYKPTELPRRFDEVIMSWDMAFKDEEESDFVVGQVWGRKGADKYLLDLVRDQLSFTETCKAVTNLSAKWVDARRKLVEDKANGPAVISALQRQVSGLIAVNPQGSKIARANAVTATIEAGNVHLPSPSFAPWVHDFIEECAGFPRGKNDDQVDAFTQALNDFAERENNDLEKLLVW